MQCFMKKDDKSLIDVEHAETTYLDNCAFFAALDSFLLQFCLVHLTWFNYWLQTYVYIYYDYGFKWDYTTNMPTAVNI